MFLTTFPAFLLLSSISAAFGVTLTRDSSQTISLDIDEPKVDAPLSSALENQDLDLSVPPALGNAESIESVQEQDTPGDGRATVGDDEDGEGVRDPLLHPDLAPRPHADGSLLLMDEAPTPRPSGPIISTHPPRADRAPSSKLMQSHASHHLPAHPSLLVHDDPMPPRPAGPLMATHPPRAKRNWKTIRSSSKRVRRASSPLETDNFASAAGVPREPDMDVTSPLQEAVDFTALEEPSTVDSSDSDHSDERDDSAISEVLPRAAVDGQVDAQDDEESETNAGEGSSNLMRRPSAATGFKALAVLPDGQLEDETLMSQGLPRDMLDRQADAQEDEEYGSNMDEAPVNLMRRPSAGSSFKALAVLPDGQLEEQLPERGNDIREDEDGDDGAGARHVPSSDEYTEMAIDDIAKSAKLVRSRA